MIDLSDYIPVGKDNAITRKRLVEITGLSDRDIRNKVEDMRKNGEPILSSSQTSGYWRSDDVDEISKFVSEMKRREQSLQRTRLAMTKRLYRLTGKKYTTVHEHIRRVNEG